MQVEQVMSHQVKSCRASDTLATAARIMWDHDIGAVPVVADGGRPVGVVTDRDICMASLIQGKLLSEIPVMNVAATEPCVAREDDPVEVVESLMRNHQVRRIPIVDNTRRLVGIISLNDIARHTRQNGGHHDALSPEVVASTLAAISAPHGA